jgi:hypothetical protein
MGLQLSYYAEEERLDLTVTEDLDQSLACQIMQACNYINDQLLTCVIDCTRVHRFSEPGQRRSALQLSPPSPTAYLSMIEPSRLSK